MATPPPPTVANPYQEGNLIFAMTTPPERASKLTLRWKGPFRVRRVPNHFQVVYEDGPAWRTVYVNHTKPAKFAAPNLPVPTPPPEPPRPALGHLPSGLVGSRPRRPPPPLPAAAPAEGRSVSPTASAPAPRPSAPATSEMPPPATAPAHQNPENARRPRRSTRLNPELHRVCTIKGPPGTFAPQSQNSLEIHYAATRGCSAKNGESRIPLRSTRAHCPPWPTALAPLDASCTLVVIAVQWRVSSGASLPPVLSRTPGTACGLARG